MKSESFEEGTDEAVLALPASPPSYVSQVCGVQLDPDRRASKTEQKWSARKVMDRYHLRDMEAYPIGSANDDDALVPIFALTLQAIHLLQEFRELYQANGSREGHHQRGEGTACLTICRRQVGSSDLFIPRSASISSTKMTHGAKRLANRYSTPSQSQRWT
jgi:hypothetical protein